MEFISCFDEIVGDVSLLLRTTLEKTLFKKQLLK